MTNFLDYLLIWTINLACSSHDRAINEETNSLFTMTAKQKTKRPLETASGREVEVKERTELLQLNLKVTPGGLLDIWSGTACQSKAKIKQTQRTAKTSPQRGHSLWLTQHEEVWENKHRIILEKRGRQSSLSHFYYLWTKTRASPLGYL